MSSDCRQTGSGLPWQVARLVSKGEYLYAVVPEHPNSTEHGYVLAHRVAVENRIGRLLGRDEVVHHLDGDKRNNDPSNLEVLTPGEHSRRHVVEKSRTVSLVCAECGKTFVRSWSRRPEALGATNAFCSHACNGRYQLNRRPIRRYR